MDWDPFLLLTMFLGLALIFTSARLMQRAFRSRESWRVREARRRREASRAAPRGHKRTSKHGADVIPLRKRPRVRGPLVAGHPTYGAARPIHRADQPKSG
jgi:beta-lactamase regulating signal transducer with metallopeptidase domain